MEPGSSLRVHKRPPLEPIMSQLNSVRPINNYLPEVHLNVTLPPTSRSSQWCLTSRPPNQNPVNTSPLPCACHMSRPPRPPWLIQPNNIRWRIQDVKFIIMHFSPRTSSSLLGPNILLNTLFSKTFSLYSFLKERDQVSHPSSTTGKSTVLCILIFNFFDMRQETKDFRLNNSKHSLNLIYYWFHHESHSVLLESSPNTWILLHLQKIH
jgi:hypothetical protein